MQSCLFILSRKRSTKKIITTFFNTFVGGLDERGLGEIDMALRGDSSLLWFLSPFCKALSEKFGSNDFTCIIYLYYLKESMKVLKQQCGAKLLNFLLFRVNQISTKSNFCFFLETLAYLRGLIHIRKYDADNLISKIEKIWINWDYDVSTLTVKQCKYILNGLYLLCKERLMNTRYILDILPMLEMNLFNEVLYHAGSFQPKLYMLQYTHYRQLILAERIFAENYDALIIKSMILILFDFGIKENVRLKVVSLLQRSFANMGRCEIKSIAGLVYAKIDEATRIDAALINMCAFLTTKGFCKPSKISLLHGNVDIEKLAFEVATISLVDSSKDEVFQHMKSVLLVITNLAKAHNLNSGLLMYSFAKKVDQIIRTDRMLPDAHELIVSMVRYTALHLKYLPADFDSIASLWQILKVLPCLHIANETSLLHVTSLYHLLLMRIHHLKNHILLSHTLDSLSRFCSNLPVQYTHVLTGDNFIPIKFRPFLRNRISHSTAVPVGFTGDNVVVSVVESVYRIQGISGDFSVIVDDCCSADDMEHITALLGGDKIEKCCTWSGKNISNRLYMNTE